MENTNKIIRDLYAKYSDNSYILARLTKIIDNLPTVLENIVQERQESRERIYVLAAKQQQFITDFMAINQYFYCSTTNMFFKYDELHYSVTTDDAIAHHVWQSMPAEEMIHDWQLSTKRFIVRRVRSRSIFQTVPESQTIQYVLDTLCPTLFESRDMAKYFLTALGDRILKKSPDRVCIITPKCSWLIQELKRASMMYFGCNAMSGFKYKYGRHDYANCRLIRITDSFINVTSSVLDLLCVALHYSERYGNADAFLENNMNDYDTYSHISYLMHRSPETVVSDFCSKYLEPGDTLLRWKHMQYLWNVYLDQNQLPAIMYLGDLKTELNNRILFDVEMDAFIGVSSRYLPEIDKFLRFWETTMQYVGLDNEQHEYELDEICSLFTRWYLSVKPDANIRERHISDKKMRGLIDFYFPLANSSNDTKCIRGYQNILWDKRRDVRMALESFRSQTTEVSLGSSVSIHDMYVWYSRSDLGGSNTTGPSRPDLSKTALPGSRDLSKTTGSLRPDLSKTALPGSRDLLKVSKAYFEKVVEDELAMYILPGKKKISADWFRGL